MKTIKMDVVNIVEDEFGAFEDEVLNAGWLPPPEKSVLAERCDYKAVAPTEDPVFDVDAFLNVMYSNQGF